MKVFPINFVLLIFNLKLSLQVLIEEKEMWCDKGD